MKDYDENYDFGALDIYVYEQENGLLRYSFDPSAWTGSSRVTEFYGKCLRRASSDYHNSQFEDSVRKECPECGVLNWYRTSTKVSLYCWRCGAFSNVE